MSFSGLLFSGFDWDEGNWPKCGKHGVGKNEIEDIFHNDPAVCHDAEHSQYEKRWLAIGQNNAGRWIFIAFTIRERQDKKFIRPISARFMHQKEIRHYEQQRQETEKNSGSENG